MMKVRVEHTIDRHQAEQYLLAATDLPATKEAFVAYLRRAVWWYGASEAGGSLGDLADDTLTQYHADEHFDCEGPGECIEPTEREIKVERLLDQYWEGE